MQLTIDAGQFFQALKRVKIRRRAYPSIQLRAEHGQLFLRTVTSAFAEQTMEVQLSLQPDTLVEEGSCAVLYRELVHAAKTLPGRLTIEVQEHRLLVRGEGPLRRQVSLEIPQAAFPTASFKEPKKQRYTKERSIQVQCPTCKQSHSSSVPDTYQVTRQIKQQLRIRRDLLTAMCAEVVWVAKEEDQYPQAFTAILFELDHDVLSLIASDSFSVVIRRQTIPGAGSWSRPVLVPATRLTRALRLARGEEILIETLSTEHQLVKRGDEDDSDALPFVLDHRLDLSTEDGTMQVSLSLLPNSFPDYREKLSLPEERRALCPADELLCAVKAMAPREEDGCSVIKLRVEGASLLLEANRSGWRYELSSPEISEGQTSDHEQVTILLDPWYVSSYVSSLLKTTMAPHVSLTYTGPSPLPVFFHAGAEQGEYIMLLAPMGQS
jgi:DNA polymerase III sliding clamp (beta) subunit (PCNA family)